MWNICALCATNTFSAFAAARISSAVTTVRVGPYGVLCLNMMYPIRDNQPKIVAGVCHTMVGVLLLVERVLHRYQPAWVSRNNLAHDKGFMRHAVVTRMWIGDVLPRAMGSIDSKIPTVTRGGSGLGGAVRIGSDPSGVCGCGLCGRAFGASG